MENSHPNNDQLADSPSSPPLAAKSPEEPNPNGATTDPTPSDATAPERSAQRAPDRTPTADGRGDSTGPRRASAFDFDAEVRRVRLAEIDGVDEEIEQFLREHDVLTEVAIQCDRWSRPMARWIVQGLHLTLWSKRGRLVHLGSGRMLTLARRLALHDETLPATIIQAKTLSLQHKLTLVGHELLFLPALHRPSAGYPAAAVALWKALDQAGVSALKRPGLQDFALATGMSKAALKRHWQAGPDQ